MTNLRTTDNRNFSAGGGILLPRRRLSSLRLALAAVALSLWWQSATPLQAQTTNAAPPPLPAAPGVPAPATVAPPMLPGQIGSTYEQAMLFGNECMKKAHFEEALTNYEAAAKFKNTPEAHVGLGYAYDNLGQQEPAMTEFFEALKINPDYALARFALGAVLMKRESWDEAAGQFMQVLKVAPTDIATRGNLAICYEQKGQLDTAIEQFKYIVQTRQNDATAHYNLACAYYFKEDVDNAMAEYRRVVQLDTKHPMAYVGLANCLLAKRDFKGADTFYKQQLRITPSNYYAYIGLGRIQELQGKEKDAEQQYKKAIAINPKAPECRKLMNNMMKRKASELGLTGLPGLN